MNQEQRASFAARLTDLKQAMDPTQEPNMTYGDLIGLLGVPLQEDGSVKSVDFINACMGVQSHEAVQGLPDDQRIRVIRSAADAISALMSGRT